MSWLAPLLAGGVAAFAVPALVVLYFLKLRRREVDVGSTLLWKKSIRDMRANAPFQRLRRNLLLFLQLLVLGLLIVAIAQPVTMGEAASGDRFVVLIDRSASMSAVTAGGETRLDVAKREALSFVRGLSTGGADARVMVVSFSGGAEVVRPFTSNLGLVESAIRGVEPGDGPSRIGSAVELVRPHVTPVAGEGDGPVRVGAELVVYSDGGIEDAGDVRLHPDTRVSFSLIGDGGANVGITAIGAERPFDDPGRADLFVGLSNSGSEAVETDVELWVDGRLVDVRGVAIGAAGEGVLGVNGVVFSLARASGVVCEVRVIDGGVLGADDRASVVIPPGRRLRVGYVGEGGDPFLDSLLESLDFASLTRMTPGAFGGLGGSADGFDLFVMEGWAPREAAVVGEGDALRLDDEPGVPEGAYVFFDVVPALAGLSRTGGDGRLAGGVVASALRDHPVLRATAIEELRVSDQVGLVVGSGGRVIAETTSGPLIAEVAHGGVRALVLGFDPASTSWFVDPNLVVLIASAVKHLTGVEGEGAGAGSLRTGDVLSEVLPGGARDVRISGPGVVGGSAGLSLTPDGRVNWGPIETAGLYEVSWAGEGGGRDQRDGGRWVRRVPVGVLSDVESDVRGREAIAFETSEVVAVNAGGGDGAVSEPRGWWRWLVIGALALLVLEWWIYNRRVYL